MRLQRLSAAASGLFLFMAAGCAESNARLARRPEPVAVPPPARQTPPPMPKPAPPTPRPPALERRVSLGHSVAGAAIDMQVFGSGRPVVFIFGGIHGSEPGSVYVAERVLEALRSDPSLWSDRTVAVVTNANPDAFPTRRRTNLNRVDVNRNFPAANFKPSALYGRAPGSEPEARAIIAAVEQLRPDAIVSLHAITGGRQCNNYDGPARPLAELMARHNGYPVTGDIGYPTPGSFGTWAGKEQGIPVLTLELPRGERGEESWRRNGPGLIELIRAVRPRGSQPPAPARPRRVSASEEQRPVKSARSSTGKDRQTAH